MANTRKLVTLRVISEKRPIRGSHYEQIFVDGWSIVAHQGEDFSVGELVVYLEIDSFIPSTDGRIWELSDNFSEFNNKKGYHVRSQFVAGKISQGMMFKLSQFCEVETELARLRKEHGEQEGTKMAKDMSFEDKLGVVKWCPPEDLTGKVIGCTPKFFPLPGANRAQNVPQIFSPAMMDTGYQITEKLDGVSMIIYHVAKTSPYYRELPELPEGSAGETQTGRVGVCSQKYDLLAEGAGFYWDTARSAGVIDKIHEVGKNVAIMGELVGHTIVDNSLGLPPGEHRYYVFNIFDIDSQKHLKPVQTVDVCNRLGFPHVPVLGYKKMRDLAFNVSELLDKAEGVGFMGQNREGIMLKGMRNDVVVKVISNSWLIQQGM